MKVCIADDDYTCRIMLTAMLKKWGYEPLAVEDGSEAWDILQKNDAPKLILLDWNMPKMNGLELIQRIRALNEHSPPYIIMVTSKTENESIIKGLDAGANDYVSKPYEPEILRARINNGKRMLEMQASLEHEASHDPLTGILNRRAIIEILSKELVRSKREKTGLLVGLCDIDHFKMVNDVYGHHVGDEVLRGFVHCVGGSLREYDSLGRWGGEEFLFVLPLRSSDDAFPLFERIRTMVADGFIATSSGSLKITISIGASFMTGNETVDESVSVADRFMYQAKNEGRNRVCCAERKEP